MVKPVGDVDRLHHASVVGTVSQAPEMPQFVGNQVLSPSAEKRVPVLTDWPAGSFTFLGVGLREPGDADRGQLAPPVAESEEGGTFPGGQGSARHGHDGRPPGSIRPPGHGRFGQVQEVSGVDSAAELDEVEGEGDPEAVFGQAQEGGRRCFSGQNVNAGHGPAYEVTRFAGAADHRLPPAGGEEPADELRHIRAAG